MAANAQALPQLQWTKAQTRGRYELIFGGDVLGSLQRRGWCSREWDAGSPAGSWMFRRVGLVGKVEIYASGKPAPIAFFKPGWCAGGVLTFDDGQMFRIRSRGFIRPIWTVSLENGPAVVVVDQRKRSVAVQATDISPARVAVLTLFSWHRILQASEEAAAAAVIGSSAAIFAG